ncbi:MAG: Stp1/IreP family PP2C-type Ser/Thr phosphatase [Oscillospiraceae bacterium]|nr:Stp1/IreP family PP2C-type Ser/Thr phosphatase [Oscillospiraceae bacterium]
MQYWAVTDSGCIRDQNQDAYQIEILDRNTLLCVVCDGMGGAKSGNVASTLAAEVFAQEIKDTWKSGMDPEELDHILRNAVKLANFTVYDQAQQFPEFEGMGTTLVALLIHGKKATIVNIGDSRAYLVDKEGIKQLTTDHSLVQMMVARGELTPEKAKRYPGKNLITRAIGTEAMVECDTHHQKAERGDTFLLCSDGLSNLLDEQEMLFEVAHGQDREQCCQRLLDIAKKRGAPDNVTCVLVTL